MKRTFITSMPDESGAFLKASRIIADAGANITRVSYNKTVDAHMLFLDVSGSEAQIAQVSEGLERIGYAQNIHSTADVILLSFHLADVPGAVTPILELIHGYNFNIAYISSMEDGSGYQNFKMGLLVEDAQEVKSFLDQATSLCEVRVIEYNHSERALDNTVFYLRFVDQMREKLGLDQEETHELMVQSNLLMQLLDEKNEAPQKTFEYIGHFADAIHAYAQDAFIPRVTRFSLATGHTLHAIEPPCGSNTYIVEHEASLMFVDSGFARYESEMRALLNQIFPDLEQREKAIMVTHPDIDHCGLLDLFDTVYVTQDSWKHFMFERRGEPNYREKNPAHAPYSRISRILSGYTPPREESLQLIAEVEPAEQTSPLTKIGQVDFGGIRYQVYRGNGGHAIGEAVFVDEANKVVFCGDIVINAHDLTPEQKAFNQLAPFLMTSVNMDSVQAKEERDYLLELFDPQEYFYCCGHGAVLEPSATR